MRTFRHARLLAATGVALSALALTACQSGTGTRDEGAAQSGSPSATKDVSKPAPGKSPQQTGGSGGSGQSSGGSADPVKSAQNGSGGKAGQGAKNDDGPQDLTICNGSNTRTTAQPVSRPLNHMLLTVTNTGSKRCALMYYPVLRFDEMQWVPQAIEDTQPQAVTMLEPGGSGYAGVLLSAADGSGTGGDTGHKLVVGFQGRTPNSDGGPAAAPGLPAKGVHYDSALSVTYWQTDMEDALD
ncbi:DUF4232 domain-containing protein [Streptomyces chartreusis]|uniref:DUF4232 domain-containing protein n=1 Tax=Streptomyces chartreusis TaxID=1969 RepID=UPI00123DD036|nr:DUF4232 domain-containing protein [Streptomyces chartreusis]QEV72512.1 DUF4232 domain-containing protein [Streptomyces chartreusis]GGX32097.1 hypothetical protein GCM10010321_53920 [Streptomyces chartreusis]